MAGLSRSKGVAAQARQRLQEVFIAGIYRHCHGNRSNLVSMLDVGRSLGYSLEQVKSVVEDLIDRGLVIHKLAGGQIRLTPAGVESAREAACKGTPGRVFVSYSHRDNFWLGRLRRHLATLERLGVIDVWADPKIEPGSAWFESILAAIASARVAVLLVSRHFFASEFIVTRELPALLAAHERGETEILPLLLSSSFSYKQTMLGGIQAFNRKPITAMRSAAQKENTFADLADTVERLVRLRPPE